MRIITMMVFLVLCGCDYSPLAERQSLVTSYSSDVYKLEAGCNYYYVARKPDGSVWIVRTEDSKEKYSTMIFPSNR